MIEVIIGFLLGLVFLFAVFLAFKWSLEWLFMEGGDGMMSKTETSLRLYMPLLIVTAIIVLIISFDQAKTKEQGAEKHEFMQICLEKNTLENCLGAVKELEE